MPNSTRSSNASAPCRLEWRPSRLLASLLCLLGVLGGCSVWASEAPWPLALGVSIAAVARGCWLARRELRRPAQTLLVADGGRRASLDDEPIRDLSLHWRGPLAFARFRTVDGRRQYLAWWPDTLGPAARRELRLAVPVQATARSARSVAP